MRHDSITDFIASGHANRAPGPVAIILAEDPVELDSTLARALDQGFATVLLLADDAIPLDPALAPRLHRIRHDVYEVDALPKAVNRLIPALAAGTWVYFSFNAEYLFFPFCETRTIRDMLAFHTEERRDAMITYVVDLYAADLSRHPNAVSRSEAHMDRSGYYGLARKDAEKDWAIKERQMDFFGGLRWRFEEHVSWPKRKIDRVSLFRTAPGLELRPDFTFNVEEYNTYSCPWHHNLTACVASFRTAKALKTNPGSRHEIASFHWRNSVAFQWNSQQLMDLGLMEPGQWF